MVNKFSKKNIFSYSLVLVSWMDKLIKSIGIINLLDYSPINLRDNKGSTAIYWGI